MLDAKAKSSAKDKRGALFALKRKKMYEGEVNKLNGARMTLESQVGDHPRLLCCHDALPLVDKPGATPSVLEADTIENGVLDGGVEVFSVARHRSGRLPCLCLPAVAVHWSR